MFSCDKQDDWGLRDKGGPGVDGSGQRNDNLPHSPIPYE